MQTINRAYATNDLLTLLEAQMKLDAATLMVRKAATMYDAGLPCGREANTAKLLADSIDLLSPPAGVTVQVAPGMPTQGNVVASVLVIIFGFFFVTVASRIVGLIGTSSNPVSGMTIATLIITCLIFVALGWTGDVYGPVALSVGAIVCIAAANAGNTSQDLKTGFLVGGTSGRTTLAGEGLQHQDGHSHLTSTTIPNCIAYDPTFAFEVVTIIQDGLRRPV